MPARLKTIAAVFKTFGVLLEKPSSGSHWKLRREGTRVYTVPASNGLKTEIGDNYIRAACRHFGIEVADFYARLQK